MSLGYSRFSRETVSSADTEEASRLIYQSLARFYDTVPGSEADRVDIIADQLGRGVGELKDTWLAYDGDDLAGVFCAFGVEELPSRQMASVQHIRKSLPRDARAEFDAAARARFGATAPPTLGAYYLSRIAVVESRRGAGDARQVLSHFIETGKPRQTYALHVDTANEGAIRFYQKNGFGIVDGSESNGYVLMEFTKDGMHD